MLLTQVSVWEPWTLRVGAGVGAGVGRTARLGQRRGRGAPPREGLSWATWDLCFCGARKPLVPGLVLTPTCSVTYGTIPLRGLRCSVCKMSVTNPYHLSPGGQRLGAPAAAASPGPEGTSLETPWPRIPPFSPRPELHSPGLMTTARANHCPSALSWDPPKARMGRGSPPVYKGN